MTHAISSDRLHGLFESIMSQEKEIDTFRSKLATLSEVNNSLEQELSLIESGNLLLERELHFLSAVKVLKFYMILTI